MSAIEEFDDTRERQRHLCDYFPEICVTNICAKVTTFRSRPLKLIKGDKGDINGSYQNAVRSKYIFNPSKS